MGTQGPHDIGWHTRTAPALLVDSSEARRHRKGCARSTQNLKMRLDTPGLMHFTGIGWGRQRGLLDLPRTRYHRSVEDQPGPRSWADVSLGPGPTTRESMVLSVYDSKLLLPLINTAMTTTSQPVCTARNCMYSTIQYDALLTRGCRLDGISDEVHTIAVEFRYLYSCAWKALANSSCNHAWYRMLDEFPQLVLASARSPGGSSPPSQGDGVTDIKGAPGTQAPDW